jgi:hypothetical protein
MSENISAQHEVGAHRKRQRRESHRRTSLKTVLAREVVPLANQLQGCSRNLCVMLWTPCNMAYFMKTLSQLPGFAGKVTKRIAKQKHDPARVFVLCPQEVKDTRFCDLVSGYLRKLETEKFLRSMSNLTGDFEKKQ